MFNYRVYQSKEISFGRWKLAMRSQFRQALMNLLRPQTCFYEGVVFKIGSWRFLTGCKETLQYIKHFGWIQPGFIRNNRPHILLKTARTLKNRWMDRRDLTAQKWIIHEGSVRLRQQRRLVSTAPWLSLLKHMRIRSELDRNQLDFPYSSVLPRCCSQYENDHCNRNRRQWGTLVCSVLKKKNSQNHRKKRLDHRSLLFKSIRLWQTLKRWGNKEQNQHLKNKTE